MWHEAELMIVSRCGEGVVFVTLDIQNGGRSVNIHCGRSGTA